MTKLHYPYSFFKDNYIRSEKAVVPIMTNALQYGTGVFAGIRGYWNSKKKAVVLFRPRDHFIRMKQSLKILGVTIPYSEEELVDILVRLVKKNKPNRDVYIRPFAFADSLNLSPNLSRDSAFAFAMYMIPLGDYLPTDKGLSLHVSSWRRISDNAVPSRGKFTGAYINSALARKEAADCGCDEALLCTENGFVAEGSAENVFFVRHETLITPQTSSDIVEGITRRTIMVLARDNDIPVIERHVNRTEAYVADELFLCGTGCQIAWVSHVDMRQVGTGTIGAMTKTIRTAYGQAVHGELEKYGEWNLFVR